MDQTNRRSRRDRHNEALPQGQRVPVSGSGTEVPPGPLDEKQERALRTLDRVARVLDSCIRIPFTRLRVGLDGLVGLVPVVGDLVSAAFSLYPIVEARRLGMGTPTILRMLANVAVDTIIGAIPIVGDLFDFGFKANLRNVDLLRKRLRSSAGDDGSTDGTDANRIAR